MALLISVYRPPSLKESGVAFKIPIIFGEEGRLKLDVFADNKLGLDDFQIY